MNFIKETVTIERTRVTFPVKELLTAEQYDKYTSNYCIDDHIDRLYLEITAEADISADTKVIEFWYGLKDYDIRINAFGMPESYLQFQSMDECIAVVLNEYVDWDRLFSAMNG